MSGHKLLIAQLWLSLSLKGKPIRAMIRGSLPRTKLPMLTAISNSLVRGCVIL